MADELESFEARAEAVSLFPAERRIVEQLLAIPAHELGIMTSSDLSERSGASRSSIDRLSRKLGYPGLKEMRKALILQKAAVSDTAQDEDGSSESLGAVGARTLRSVAARAEALAQALGRNEDLDAVVDWMLAAGRINLFGSGESAATCDTIFMRLVRLGLPVQFSSEHHTQVTLASLMGQDDVALCVSYSGNTKATLWAAQQARINGAKIVVVTGNGHSSIGKIANKVVLLPTGKGLPGSAEVLDRIIGASIGEVLFQCLITRRPELAANSIKIDDTFGEARG